MNDVDHDLAVLTLALSDDGRRPARVVTSSLRTARTRPGVDGTVLVVRVSAPSGTSAAGLLRHAAAQAVVSRARPSSPGSVHRDVVRLPARRMKDGRLARARARLAAGVVVRLSDSPLEQSVLGAVLDEAGGLQDGRVVGVSGGVLLVRARRGDQQVLLRLAPVGAPGDPSGVAEALVLLERLHVSAVPRLVGAGRLAGASWSAETLLPGRRPAHLTPQLTDDVLARLADLPGLQSSVAARPLTHVLTDVLPGLADAAERLEIWGASRTDGLPGVVRHGDLWSGNLLTERGRLSGLVDWDAFEPAGTPGTDLFHLLATAERLATRRSTGALLLSEPWLRSPFRPALQRYWTARGLGALDDDTAAGIAVAWWSAQTAADLTRRPWLAQDETWVSSTLRLVLPRWQA